jgi:hypothetical protein
VHILQPDGSTKIISDPDEMYNRIIDQDIQHYGQAEGTPCTITPLKDWLGSTGDTAMCDSWLQGSALPTISQALPETQLLVNLLACPIPLTPIDNSISLADYKAFFEKWAKNTSTSQERHLDHWIALISHSAQQHFPDDSNLIIETLVAQMNLSLTHGYTWKRWHWTFKFFKTTSWSASGDEIWVSGCQS